MGSISSIVIGLVAADHTVYATGNIHDLGWLDSQPAGAVSFTFKASDGKADSNLGTVTINVRR